MAVDKLVDSSKLDACCTAEANAIRAKTGDSSTLTYDWSNSKGFADAIAAIPTGGGTTLYEGNYVNVGVDIVTSGENSVTNASQIKPYLFGLSSLTETNAMFICFSVVDHSQSFENNEVVCANLNNTAIGQWYRYNNGTFGGKPYDSPYDAKIVSGTKYLIACYYWEGAPT